MAVDRAGVLAQRYGERAARHSMGQPRKAQQMIFHDIRQMGITPSDREAFDRV